MQLAFSIVITTYNRESVLKRCLNSIVEQGYENYEVIIVDDHSTINYEENILKDYPFVKYIYQKKNVGPGENRNYGISLAENDYVIIMDDDDVFHKDAFTIINESLQSIDGIEKYPVVNFLGSNGKLNYQDTYKVNTFEDLTNGAIVGDVIHIINKEVFTSSNFKFPTTRIGGELLLWFDIALKSGYPIFNKEVVQVMSDSEDRLTNFTYQAKRAKLFKEYQIQLIENFEEELKKNNNYSFLINKYKGAIIYALLDGDKKNAYIYIKNSMKYSKKQVVLLVLLFLPKSLIQQLLLMYRKKSS